MERVSEMSGIVPVLVFKLVIARKHNHVVKKNVGACNRALAMPRLLCLGLCAEFLLW